MADIDYTSGDLSQNVDFFLATLARSPICLPTPPNSRSDSPSLFTSTLTPSASSSTLNDEHAQPRSSSLSASNEDWTSSSPVPTDGSLIASNVLATLSSRYYLDVGSVENVSGKTAPPRSDSKETLLQDAAAAHSHSDEIALAEPYLVGSASQPSGDLLDTSTHALPSLSLAATVGDSHFTAPTSDNGHLYVAESQLSDLPTQSTPQPDLVGPTSTKSRYSLLSMPSPLPASSHPIEFPTILTPSPSPALAQSSDSFSLTTDSRSEKSSKSNSHESDSGVSGITARSSNDDANMKLSKAASSFAGMVSSLM